MVTVMCPQIHSDLHKRKKTGGRKRIYRKKRKYEIGGDLVKTMLGERRVKVERARGGNVKLKLLSDQYANVLNPKTGICKKLKVLKVERNPADKNYDREGVITKGTIIVVESGKAVVTSRPGQEGVINAVLIPSS